MAASSQNLSRCRYDCCNERWCQHKLSWSTHCYSYVPIYCWRVLHLSHNWMVRDKFRMPNVSLFFTLWVSLFMHRAKETAMWKDTTDCMIAMCSQTRWRNRRETILQILEQFGHVDLSCVENSDLSNTTQSKLLEIVHDLQQLLSLKVEVTATVDVGVHKSCLGSGKGWITCTQVLQGDA